MTYSKHFTFDKNYGKLWKGWAKRLSQFFKTKISYIILMVRCSAVWEIRNVTSGVKESKAAKQKAFNIRWTA